MNDERQQIEKLTGEENWPTWHILMKVILECDGTYDVVDGNSMKPEQGVEDYMGKLDCWSKAKKHLVLSLDTQPLLRVAACETAKDVWNKLHQIYDNQSAENIDLLRNKFNKSSTVKKRIKLINKYMTINRLKILICYVTNLINLQQ
ncbi:hypothetical protein QE152_g26498 [Popillia japonica]|uniref:Uncharacterized protein n=1 Tax=Popillia japonica TaxID=7064 RepID=A0AAW1JY38_POPJA